MTSERQGVPSWMAMEAEPLSETKIVQGSSPSARTAQMILTAISDGRFKVGERLPAERSLADVLRVGRSAVREALSALEILGVVEVMPGSGTYVRATSSGILPQTLSWGLLIERDSLADLMDIRESLEVTAAQLVAERFPDVELDGLRATVDAQRSAIADDDAQAYVRADQQFHVELAVLSDNDLLGYLVASVRGLLRVWIERQVRRPHDMRRALAEHAAVLDALGTGDVAAATGAMRVHMETSAHRLMDVAAPEGK